MTANAVAGVEKTGHLVVDKEANLTVTAESSVHAEVIVKDGTLHNEGSIEDRITLMGGKVSGSGVFAGIDMTGGKLVVGNSPGMQRYTDEVNLSGGTVVFSVAGAEAASAGSSGCVTLTPGQSLVDIVKSYSYSMSGDTLVLSVTLAGNGKGVASVPEPTTATLSLLALAARRRRK